MILFDRSLDDEIVVVAEIGVNHAGSVNWILDMLLKIKDSGASAVKLQLFTPNLYSTREDKSRHEFLNGVYLSESDFLEVSKVAKSLELQLFATPLSHDWVRFIAESCGVVKIASGDFTFHPTVISALKTSAKIIASTGACSTKDIDSFLALAKSFRSEQHCQESIALLHCVSAYPPPLQESNLMAIQALKQLTNLTVGFSSHFLDDAPIYGALALGARIFEIHVTDSRERTDIRDHKLSRTPSELKTIVDNLEALNLSLKQKDKAIQPSELQIVNAIRKGIVYSCDFKKGHVLKLSDLEFARPNFPEIESVDSLIGKTLSRDVYAFHSSKLQDFE